MKAIINEVKRIWNALGYSLEGLTISIKTEAAFKTEVILLIILLPLVLWLPIATIKKLFIIESMVLVLLAELLNIALETCVNYISEAKHPLAKKIKDVASAAVFISLINSISMWAWGLWDLLQTYSL
ncbi:MAG: diacylglycerol kinase [Verrucomicrobia bacterium]|nr:MAG: diacylglycerol kinase [Verrucomicrobiota bacterium]